MRGQRGKLRVLAVICQSLKLFLVSGSLFSETSAREIRKANFNHNGGFVVGTHKHFRGDTRGLCFSCYTRGLCSQITQRTNKSQFVFVYVIIQS